MNHDDAIRNRTAASYLLGNLSEAQRDAFERHYVDCRICSEDVRTGVAMSSNGREVAVEVCDDTAEHLTTRDPEVMDVLDTIRRRLEAIEAVCGRERDEALYLVETYAAPYALMLFYEVERLESTITRMREERAEN